jgi:hypothetical protein
MTSTWFRISLSRKQVEAGHIGRIEEDVTALFAAAGSPAGAAVFALQRDGGEDLFFTPIAAALAEKVLHANGGTPSAPPLDDGDIALLVGHSVDVRLLSS